MSSNSRVQSVRPGSLAPLSSSPSPQLPGNTPQNSGNAPSGGSNNVLDALDSIVHKKRQSALARTDKKKKKTRDEEEEERRFVSSVSQILAMLPKDASPSLWTRLFYERMIASQSISSASQLEHYRDIFADWLELLPSSDENVANRKLALSFLQYASVHVQDPDNSLLGLNASEKALAIAQKPSDRRAAGPLVAGELLVVRRHKGQPLVFARLLRPADSAGRHMLTCDPAEAETELFGDVDVLFFDDRLKQDYLSSAKMMEKLVVSPADEFFASLNADIRSRSSIFLQEQGINVPVLKKFAKNEVTILDSNVLKTIRGQLATLLDGIEQSEFFKTIRVFASERVDKFLNEIEVRALYPPMRQRTLQLLRTTPFSALAKVDIQKFIAVCDAAQDILTLERRRLLDGSMKRDLTDWWLNLIKEATEKFLKEEGYDLDAVPFNYIQHAPKSMDVVKRNLSILQGLLGNLSDRSTRVHQLIADMRAQINPRIDDFTEKAQFILCDMLEIDRFAFTLDRAKSMLQSFLQRRAAAQAGGGGGSPAGTFPSSSQGTATPPPASASSLSNNDQALRDALYNLTLDVEYLREMKHLEENPANEGGLKLGVVPISGMIVGYFYRYENELITVLDVWGSREERENAVARGPAKRGGALNDSPIERTLAAAAQRARRNSVVQVGTTGGITVHASEAGALSNTFFGYDETTLGSAHLALLRLASLDAPEREDRIEEAKEERLRDVAALERRENSESLERQTAELLREFQELQVRQLKIVTALRDRSAALQEQLNQRQAETLHYQLAALVRQESERQSAAPGSTRVKLNVGGRRFHTTLATITASPDSLLARMMRNNGSADASGAREVFIDRDGTHFHHVLNFLRDGDSVAVPSDTTERAAVAREARFYHLFRLAALLETSQMTAGGTPAYLQHIPTPPLLSHATHSSTSPPQVSTASMHRDGLMDSAVAPGNFDSTRPRRDARATYGGSNFSTSNLTVSSPARRDMAPGSGSSSSVNDSASAAGAASTATALSTTAPVSAATASTATSRATISTPSASAGSASASPVSSLGATPTAGSSSSSSASSSAASAASASSVPSAASPPMSAAPAPSSTTPPSTVSAASGGSPPTAAGGAAAAAGGSASTPMYEFLLASGLPEDACKQYEKIFADKGVILAPPPLGGAKDATPSPSAPVSLFSLSTPALLALGIKMGHSMKIQSFAKRKGSGV